MLKPKPQGDRVQRGRGQGALRKSSPELPRPSPTQGPREKGPPQTLKTPAPSPWTHSSRGTRHAVYSPQAARSTGFLEQPGQTARLREALRPKGNDRIPGKDLAPCVHTVTHSGSNTAGHTGTGYLSSVHYLGLLSFLWAVNATDPTAQGAPHAGQRRAEAAPTFRKERRPTDSSGTLPSSSPGLTGNKNSTTQTAGQQASQALFPRLRPPLTAPTRAGAGNMSVLQGRKTEAQRSEPCPRGRPATGKQRRLPGPLPRPSQLPGCQKCRQLRLAHARFP